MIFQEKIVWTVLLIAGLSLPNEPTAPVRHGSMTTRERLALSSWWPTRAAANAADYVGSERCANCHGAIARSQSTSQMAHTLSLASTSTVLPSAGRRGFHLGPYEMTVDTTRDQATLHVRHAEEQQSARLHWAFGSGEVGQSYMWQEPDGGFREARFNYFASIDRLDETPGRLKGAPTSIDMALGRRVEAFEAKTCFACHTTRYSDAVPMDEKSIVPGVGCESCHGPGRQHVETMASAKAPSGTDDLHIVNARRMAPAQSVDFCGACHSTPWDVRLMGAVGVQTVRFPAYRLEKSRCWGPDGDQRITCIACHDPHQPLQRSSTAYDTACLACHSNGNQKVKQAHASSLTCKVATSKCVTCHMQKYDLPEMHAKFTDHMIRVAAPGAPFPN